MAALLILFSLLAYALAALLLWRDRAWRAPLVLLAGGLTVLLLPFWLYLYRMMPADTQTNEVFGIGATTAAVFGGPLIALPALLFCAGLSQRWWSRHYAFVWIGYIAFALYFLAVGRLVLNSNILPTITLFGSSQGIILAVLPLLMAGVTLGVVFTLISTRDYPILVAFLTVALSGVISTALFWGLLGSPLWAARFFGFDDPSSTMVWGLIGVTVLLVLWGVHLLASVLHAGRRHGFAWG